MRMMRSCDCGYMGRKDTSKSDGFTKTSQLGERMPEITYQSACIELLMLYSEINTHAYCCKGREKSYGHKFFP